MAEYIGLRRIAQRMGYKCGNSMVGMLSRDGFPMYRRYRRGKLVWVTHDELILQWELERVALERARIERDNLYQHVRRTVVPANALAGTGQALDNASHTAAGQPIRKTG